MPPEMPSRIFLEANAVMGLMVSVKGYGIDDKDLYEACAFRLVTEFKAMVTPSYLILVNQS